MIQEVLELYGLDPARCEIKPLTSGLINNTWKVISGGDEYVVQRINDQVFRKPLEVAANIRMIDAYLREHSPNYFFVAPLMTTRGEDIVFLEAKGFFRVFPFVKGSHTINVVSNPGQAFQASLHFGKFTRLLSGFEARLLHMTIPDFHNLTLRFQQFQKALKGGDDGRIRQSKGLIEKIGKYESIVTRYEKIRQDPEVKQRVTHHDTKISNVLFDDEGKGMCVIDLDTVMPGHFISDVGDMMRTYLSPANEEEKDFGKIEVREDYFRAIINGYLSSMGDELTPKEQQLLLYSGQFLIFMQAMRFLTDHLNRDVYYGARYEDHNFVRAGNQLTLLERLDEKAGVLEHIISAELKTGSHFIF